MTSALDVPTIEKLRVGEGCHIPMVSQSLPLSYIAVCVRVRVHRLSLCRAVLRLYLHEYSVTTTIA